mgnify:FL=1
MTNNWFVIALIGMLSFAGMALTLKKLTYTLDTSIIVLYLFVITSILYAALNVKRGIPLSVPLTSLSLLILASFFAFLGNLCDVEALKLAPNAGYAGAVKGGQIMVITFAAYFLFKDQQLSWTGVMGVFLIFGGLVLLAFQKN